MSWSQTGSVASGGGYEKIRIKTKHGELGLTNLETQQVGSTVNRSRSILPQVIAQLSWPTGVNKARIDGLMERYFLTDAGGASGTEKDTILKKLYLVMNGINAKLNVKVAPDDGAYGYVGFKTGVLGALRGAFSPRHTSGKRQGKIVSRGDIHLDTDVLSDADLAVITFIHEATHKYASTADFGDRGYLENTGQTFEAPGLTKAEALNNADSYAWFCVSV